MTTAALLTQHRYDDGSGWRATYDVNGFEWDADFVNGEVKVYPARARSQYGASRRVKGAMKSARSAVERAHRAMVERDAAFMASHRELYELP